MEPELLIVLGAGAFAAGLVDAVVGGGGLIQVPLLFSTFPGTAVATLFGTNKLASVVGTASAAWRYARRIPIPWHETGPAALAAGLGAWLGARSVALFPSEAVRPVILVLLIAVALHTFLRKEFGAVAGPALEPERALRRAVAIGAGIGFYDGFFGPGTGSFLIFLFVRALGMDFLHASASAKIVNVTTNVAAIAFFAGHAELLWQAAAVMALGNFGGAQVGSALALRHGARFVRKVFLAVVLVLILRFGWQTICGSAGCFT